MIGSLPPQRGVSQYTFDLASELARHDGVELDMLAFRSLYPRMLYPGGDPDDRTANASDVPGAPTRRALRWWNPFGWLLAGLTLRGEVVHAQWWSFPLAPIYVTLLAIARVRGKRVVVTVHNAEPHERGLLRRIANRAVLPFAQRIIVHTEQNARSLVASGIAHDRISIVPIGVGSARRPSQEELGAARARLGIGAGSPVVLFHGNIRPYKGLADLFHAFRIVVESLPDARLLVAGQPWGSPEEITAQIASLGLAECVSARLEYVSTAVLADHFAAADVVVYPYTHFDAQSAAACDAVRYGKAIIVTSVGGLPDLVRNELAVVLPARPDALANAIIAVLRDPALREALERDSLALGADLAWPNVAGQTCTVYRDALHGVAPKQRVVVEEQTAAKEAATWR
jgi:glycosyltransferase involved in cell wall biosynthesis